MAAEPAGAEGVVEEPAYSPNSPAYTEATEKEDVAKADRNFEIDNTLDRAECANAIVAIAKLNIITTKQVFDPASDSKQILKFATLKHHPDKRGCDENFRALALVRKFVEEYVQKKRQGGVEECEEEKFYRCRREEFVADVKRFAETAMSQL